MPKMKTHSGAKKRFSVTGSGKVRRLKAYKYQCAEITSCNFSNLISYWVE